MRKALALAALLATSAAVAVGFTLNGTPVNFTDCAVGGSAAQTVVAGPNWVRTTSTENVWICLSATTATCASNGDLLPPNTSILLNISQVSAACRSTLSTGDVTFTPVQ